MMYRKLKRVWSHGYANYVPKMKEVFPELEKLSSDDMCDRWIELGIDFYVEKLAPVKLWMRLTLPFALITLVLMFIGLPICFIITGKWGYSLTDENRIYNWFKALRLD